MKLGVESVEIKRDSVIFVCSVSILKLLNDTEAGCSCYDISEVH